MWNLLNFPPTLFQQLFTLPVKVKMKKKKKATPEYSGPGLFSFSFYPYNLKFTFLTLSYFGKTKEQSRIPNFSGIME